MMHDLFSYQIAESRYFSWVLGTDQYSQNVPVY